MIFSKSGNFDIKKSGSRNKGKISRNKSIASPAKNFKLNNSKYTSKSSKGVSCNENPRNYYSHGIYCADEPKRSNSVESNLNRSENSNRYSIDKNINSDNKLRKLNINNFNTNINSNFKSGIKSNCNFNDNNPNDKKKNNDFENENVNDRLSSNSPGRNMHINNLEKTKLKINNFIKQSDPQANSTLKRAKSGEAPKSTFTSSSSNKLNKTNKIFKDLYNFEDQFKFANFKRENIDSYFALRPKYKSDKSKKNYNKAGANAHSNSRRSKHMNKSFYNSNSAENFISQQKLKPSSSSAAAAASNIKNHFEKLYNDGFALENKILQKKNLSEKNFLQNSKPQITKKAKRIVRDANLFHCRLYPYHKINDSLMHVSGYAHRRRSVYEDYEHNENNNNKLNRTFSGGISYANNSRGKILNNKQNEIFAVDNYQSLKSEMIKYKNKNKIWDNNDNNEGENENNNTFTGVYCNIVENIKKLEGIDDVKSFKIYRTSKSKRKGLYDEYEKPISAAENETV